MRRVAQRGFTLIELMISLTIGSLLVIMVLTIFSRMSFAYREQQQIVNVQQVLTAARTALDLDAKQAGLAMAQGFKLPTSRLSPVRIVNSSTGPDEVGFYYADPSVQALATTTGTPTIVTFDSVTGFVPDEVVVLTNVTLVTSTINPTDAKIAQYDTCILQIAAINGTIVTFSQAAPWGITSNGHCPNTIANTTMMYKFVAHYWRIDPSRPGLGVLQRSDTGNLIPALNDFQDMAYQFTDLQLATYFYDNDGVDTNDPNDTDGNRDWYSSTQMATFVADKVNTTDLFLEQPLQIAISLVARTERDVEGVFTDATPALTVTGNTNNNALGDRPSVALPSATDTTLQGNRIYRHTTFRVDLRNIGVGQ